MADISPTHPPTAADERDLEQLESAALVPIGAATDQDVLAPDGPDQSMVTQSAQAPAEPESQEITAAQVSSLETETRGDAEGDATNDEAQDRRYWVGQINAAWQSSVQGIGPVLRFLAVFVA
jgi:hypothetical protein